MKKKLAIVLSHPIQHFCPLYVNWAKSEQWEICVFFGSINGAKPYYDPDFKRMVTWEGLGLDQFQHVFLNGDKDLPITTELDSPALFEALDQYAPDAILTYGYWQKLQRRAREWGKKRGLPVLFFSDAELRHKRSFLKEMVKKVVVARYLKTADWFLTTGNANEEYYLKYGVPARKFVRSSYPIDYNGYETAFADREKLRREARAQFGIADDETMVSVVGKLVDWKRQSDLVKAVGAISDKKVVAVLIGSGERENAFKAVAAQMPNNRAVFTGFIEAHQLPGLYAATDIYVHTSEIEPHSVAVSEAIFSGCPVVISHTCGSYGTDDDVQIGRNGFVYPCGDTDALAANIRRLALDPVLLKKMSETSRAIGHRNQHNAHWAVPGTLHTLLFN